MSSKTFLVISICFILCGSACAQQPPNTHPDFYENLWSFVEGDPHEQKQAIQFLENHWDVRFTAPILSVIYMSRSRVAQQKLLDVLKDKTDQSFSGDVFKWYQWLWAQEIRPPENYGEFMGHLYKGIDPHFERYFASRDTQSTIRLDEILWGGVVQDGIPPLRQPKMLLAEQADYLEDDHIIFGVEINGDVRAYPKRILAWHEMFVDEVGGVAIAGVYCTLCGTVIIYELNHEGERHELGTSGFLYRSNKLMYDQKTQSLWNTIEGEPVLGPLVGKGIKLKTRSVVTTDWKSWKKMHPGTIVLDINTGYRRDYGEGVAYQNYFATDELMFEVPQKDERLANKEEVLIVRAPGYTEDPLAISTTYLKKKKSYRDKVGDSAFIVLTDKSGASRVYADPGVNFKKRIHNTEWEDEYGLRWTTSETSLKSDDGKSYERLSQHRIFWFAWFNTYPHTRLVK